MKRRILSTSIALVAAMQAGQSSADSILEEVIVTAQKREQAITDVALTVTAINGDVARAMGIEDARIVRRHLTSQLTLQVRELFARRDQRRVEAVSS